METLVGDCTNQLHWLGLYRKENDQPLAKLLETSCVSEDGALKNSGTNGVAAVNFVNLLETSYVSGDDAWKCSKKTSAPFANYAKW